MSDQPTRTSRPEPITLDAQQFAALVRGETIRLVVPTRSVGLALADIGFPVMFDAIVAAMRTPIADSRKQGGDPPAGT